jgi:tmRNA-binding protein
MKVAPGDDEWDSFIRHLYGAKHPVRSIMLQGYTVKSVKHEQVILDERYVTREATRVYPFDPECTAVFKSVSCPTQ